MNDYIVLVIVLVLSIFAPYLFLLVRSQAGRALFFVLCLSTGEIFYFRDVLYQCFTSASTVQIQQLQEQDTETAVLLPQGHLRLYRDSSRN